MSDLKQYYEEKFRERDPYHLREDKNRAWLLLAEHKIGLIHSCSTPLHVTRSLDVGCGDWGIFHAIPHTIGSDFAIGCDISMNAVKLAKQRCVAREKVEFMVLDAQLLPFRDSIFDFIYCSEVLEHLRDPTNAIDEISRVLESTRGHCILSCPNEELTGKLGDEHLQYFGYSSFKRIVRRRFEITREKGVCFFVRSFTRLPFSKAGKFLFRLLLLVGNLIPSRSVQIILVCRKSLKNA